MLVVKEQGLNVNGSQKNPGDVLTVSEEAAIAGNERDLAKCIRIPETPHLRQ